MTNTQYREWLIGAILEMQTKNQWSDAQLREKSIRVLEIIFDNVD